MCSSKLEMHRNPFPAGRSPRLRWRAYLLTTPSRPRSWLGRGYPSTFPISLCLRRLDLGTYGFLQF